MKGNPREHANLWSLLTFRWLSPLIDQGNKSPLRQSDFPPLCRTDKTDHLTLQLELSWLKEQERAKKKSQKPNLWRALLGLSSVSECLFLLSMFWLGSLCIISTPLLLYWLLRALKEGVAHHVLYFALGISLMSFVRSLVWCHGFYRCQVLGMRVRTAITGIIYKKVLTFTSEDLSAVTTGHVMNLISNDINRFDRVMLFIPRCFSAPLEVIGLAVLVHWIAGWPALVGIAVTMVLILYQIYGSRTSAMIRRKALSITDQRITQITDIITGIRTVKMHAWEKPSSDIVIKTRKAEVTKYRWMYTIEALFSSFENATLATFAFVLVLVFTSRFENSGASVPEIFSVMAAFASIRVSAQRILGYGLKTFQTCCVSEQRIRDFLEKADASYKKNKTHVKGSRKDAMCPTQGGDQTLKPYIMIQDLAVRFSEEKPILHNINLSFSNNELVAVIGAVGSGKSTLMSTILGQVSWSEGRVTSVGRVAYAPQVPWIFNGTIRENITFGAVFEAERYNQVTRSCDLVRDFESLTNGDLTVIGERGAALSGGQRARVSLARAVYANSDIYLVDDTLSALDAKVGKHVYEKCINGLLKDKLRLLVTHQTQYLEQADRVISIEDSTARELKLEEVQKEAAKVEVSEETTGEAQLPEVPLWEKLLDSSKQGLLQRNEERDVGKVSWRTYVRYLRSGMVTPVLMALVAFVIITPVLDSVPGLLMSSWTHASWWHVHDRSSIINYLSVSLSGIACRFLQPFLIYQAMLTCNSALHNKMLSSVIKSPAIFFDRNPVGRILNRFSADIGYLDDIFPYAVGISVLVIDALLALAIPSFANAWFLLLSLPPLGFYIWYGKLYFPVSREVTRLQSLARTPVYSHYSSSMDGLTTITVHQAQGNFIQNLYSHQDNLTRAWFVYISTIRWLTFRYYMVSSGFMTVVIAISTVLIDSPGVIGYSIAYAIKMLGKTDFLIRNIAEAENQMTSAQRIINYSELPPEPGYTSDRSPPENWPNQGEVELKNVSLRYYKGGPLVLKDVSFKIASQEKIGIAGRTGAGKTSIIACLLRMPEGTGDVIIDGQQLSPLNLLRTRQAISVIQQNPILFCRSIRQNLDPLGLYSDDEIWSALHSSQMGKVVANLRGKLEYEVKEGGANFSAGQRQLFCIARALLHKNKIIIMDEATANVDQATDKLIQSTIRENFKHCTVIIIAHRLSTILDCDRIMMLDNGQIMEFDTPENLASKPTGWLTRLLQHSQL